MRLLILFTAILLATNAFAGDDKRTVTKELDKSSPQTPAAPVDTELSDAKETFDRSRAKDYNSSRSNNVNGAAPQPIPTNDPPSATRAQDYNSSRSNTTAVMEQDDEGDSVETDECPDSVDNDCAGPRDDDTKAAEQR